MTLVDRLLEVDQDRPRKGEDWRQLFGHLSTSKACSWDEVIKLPLSRMNAMQKRHVKNLMDVGGMEDGPIDLNDIETRGATYRWQLAPSPCATLGDDWRMRGQPMEFVGILTMKDGRERLFYVNTEGHNYCRYTLEITDQPSTTDVPLPD